MNERAPTRNDRKFFYEMTKEEVTEFARKVSALKMGDTYERIVRVLGRPSADREVWTKGPKQQFAWRQLVYHTRKYEEGLVSLKFDRYVKMILDRRGILVEIHSKQQGIPSRTSGVPAGDSVRDSE